MQRSPDHSGANAGEHDDKSPGTSGIWTFVFIDMIAFALFFAVFVSERFRLPEVFTTSQSALDPMAGLVGTLLLICSSWFVAEAVSAVRKGLPGRARISLNIAMLLGLGFAVNKLIEYAYKFEHGLTPVTNGFFSFYFIITGLHFVHVIGGLCFLGHCRLRMAAESGESHFRKKIENTGLFWHFVDLLWLFIFPMFYLTGAPWSG